MAQTNMSSDWQYCITYCSHTFLSGDIKEMSTGKNGGPGNKLCQTSLIFFKNLYGLVGVMNRVELEDLDAGKF